jgi:ABC-type multidrug transport system permease subunit
VRKETKNGMYGPLAYVVSQAIVQIPFVFITSTFSVIPYYWMNGINDDGM